ncbi:MAG TPA: hypothetical protein VN673_00255 [Clostridia bacterium]|nr:hypothetical protein [Clostridia bacterium]
MDNFEKPSSPASTPSEPASLQEQFDSLRHLVISVLVLVIVISGTLNLFLLRQAKDVQNNVNASRQIVDEFNKTTAPVANDFVAKLVEYGQKHPDFVPILMKYGLTKPPGATGAAPSVVPPVKAPAPKK